MNIELLNKCEIIKYILNNWIKTYKLNKVNVSFEYKYKFWS